MRPKSKEQLTPEQLEKLKAFRDSAQRPRGRGPMGVVIESPADFGKTMMRLLRYFGPQAAVLLPAVGLIIGGVVLNTLAPAMIGNAIKNHLELDPNVSAFVREMTTILWVYIGVWLANGLGSAMIIWVSNRFIFRLRNEAFSHIQKLSMAFFDRRGIGDIISRLTNDVEMIFNALTNAFSSLVTGLFSIIGVFIAMVALNLQLFLVVLATVPLMVVLTGVIGKRVRQAFRQNQAQVGMLNANIQESVTSVRVIKTFHREEEEFGKFEKINETARRVGVTAEFTSYAFMPIMRFMTGLTLALVIGVGGYLVLTRRGVFSIGLLTAFILYSRRFFEPLRQITGVYNVLQSGMAGAERIFGILDTKPDITNKPEALALDDIEGDVEFRDVHFAYLENKPVLEGISLEAKKGQVIAIVGPTGAGKTTMVNLLSRFYDVGTGAILVDGKDIRELEIDSLRTKMGVVLQEPFFFATTIRENLLYANPDAAEEQMVRAATLANADAFIRRLPQGYDTPLTERGMNLSQGERQLLAIARAILADPRILILDEATSNIDSLTEAHIQQGLLELMKGRTSFIIAHRLSTIKNADKVLVVHNKSIIEKGTHRELMERKGFYWRLYRMQRTKVEITEDMEI